MPRPCLPPGLEQRDPAFARGTQAADEPVAGEVLDVVDIAEPEAGPGQKRYDVSTAGVNYTDTHHALSDN